ncbi:glutaredoxin family protein [Euzebya tangerina]|uniref:glutaredoxin family protein n=1 Tax=Euzebya tangerina TaxID=591198 RepID=UPI0013C2F10A|nr:glutaredoxin family protein [Euzebya tangerina]
MSTITLYTRQGCHLCDEADAIIRRLATPEDVIRLIDIDAHPDIADDYTVRVPVVVVDGVEVAQLHVNEAALAATLAAKEPSSGR